MFSESTCAPTSDMLTLLAVFPSISALIPAAIENRGARRVPAMSSGPVASPNGTVRMLHGCRAESCLMRSTSSMPGGVAANT